MIKKSNSCEVKAIVTKATIKNETPQKGTNQKQLMKSKKAEANARRKVNKSWEKVEHTP